MSHFVRSFPVIFSFPSFHDTDKLVLLPVDLVYIEIDVLVVPCKWTWWVGVANNS